MQVSQKSSVTIVKGLNVTAVEGVRNAASFALIGRGEAGKPSVTAGVVRSV